MPRQLPENWRDEKVPDITPKTDDYITQVRDYELITPLFGGGVEPQKADPVTVVRATEIRGQLRFWWRATRGGQFNSIEDLKRAEDAVWGSTQVSSEIQLEITIENSGFPLEVRDSRGNAISAGHPTSPYSYGAFPLFVHPENTLQKGVSFKLRISYLLSNQDDVEAALWAWETFGGLGGRTRRGFGALRLKNANAVNPSAPPSDRAKANEWLRNMLKKYVVGNHFPRYVPHLSINTAFVMTRVSDDCDRLWRENLLERLKSFRHQRERNTLWRRGRRHNNVEQPPEQKPAPGRNYWPEPDAIRRRAKRWANYIEKVRSGGFEEQNIHDHRQSTLPKEQDVFPRAAFGLPIQFSFKQDDQHNGHVGTPGDPSGTNIIRGVKRRRNGNTEYYERWASPLILRPLACQNGRFIGVALRLEGSELPDELEIGIALDPGRGVRDEAQRNVRTRLTIEEAAAIPEFTEFRRGGNRIPDTSLLRSFDGSVTTDVIQAFLAYMDRKEQ